MEMMATTMVTREQAKEFCRDVLGNFAFITFGNARTIASYMKISEEKASMFASAAIEYGFADFKNMRIVFKAKSIKEKSLNDWLKETYKVIDLGYTKYPDVRERLKCADGFHMSIQASEYHYCTPRKTMENGYTNVEVGFPSEKETLLMPYAEDTDKPTETVYGYVPINIVEAVIKRHGGIA